jgi:hypothetical protein
MKNLALLAFMGALCTISACSKGAGYSPASGNDAVASKAEAQPPAAVPKVATVVTQPTNVRMAWRPRRDVPC